VGKERWALGPATSSHKRSLSRPQRWSVTPVEIEVNVTISPVSGEAGTYVKEATGAARAGCGVTATIARRTIAPCRMTADARVAKGIVAPPRGHELDYWTDVRGEFFPWCQPGTSAKTWT
jgi:hypothetical protein